jgi:hypothetical protein
MFSIISSIYKSFDLHNSYKLLTSHNGKMVEINPEYMVYVAMIAEAYRHATLYTGPKLIVGYVKEKIMPKNNLETKLNGS